MRKKNKRGDITQTYEGGGAPPPSLYLLLPLFMQKSAPALLSHPYPYHSGETLRFFSHAQAALAIRCECEEETVFFLQSPVCVVGIVCE